MASSFTANQQQQQHHHHHHHHSQQHQQHSHHQQQQQHHHHQHHHHLQTMQTPLIHPQHPPQQQLQQPQQHQYQQQQHQQQQLNLSQSQASNLDGCELKDSTFIHGTIELGTDHTNEPVVGREQIEKKMNELKLNDCRAKIKQIDCLETLAGGLVIQVIGELSNNGRPMRRFLQTFVLAPSPDQPSHEGDQPGHMRATNDNRRGVQISESSSNSSHNKKFYVLNSIFRYQDDGPDSEFEDDAVSLQAQASVDSANGHTNETNNDNHTIKSRPSASTQHQQQQIHHASPPEQPQAATTPSIPAVAPKQPTAPEAVADEPKRGDDAVQVAKRTVSSSVSTGPSNGNVRTDKKADTPEKVSTEKEPPISDSGANQSAAPKTSQTTPTTVVAQSSVRAPNEPKTWANMVRNALPPSSTIQPSNVTSSKDQQPSPPQASSNPVNQPNTQQQNENQPNNNNNNNTNNRRQRHVIRKPSNKPGSGRTMKNRNPRPPVAPAAPAGKPAA